MASGDVCVCAAHVVRRIIRLSIQTVWHAKYGAGAQAFPPAPPPSLPLPTRVQFAHKINHLHKSPWAHPGASSPT